MSGSTLAGLVTPRHRPRSLSYVVCLRMHSNYSLDCFVLACHLACCRLLVFVSAFTASCHISPLFLRSPLRLPVQVLIVPFSPSSVCPVGCQRLTLLSWLRFVWSVPHLVDVVPILICSWWLPLFSATVLYTLFTCPVLIVLGLLGWWTFLLLLLMSSHIVLLPSSSLLVVDLSYSSSPVLVSLSLSQRSVVCMIPHTFTCFNIPQYHNPHRYYGET